MSEKITTASLIAQYLSRAGIRYIFGYPGGPNLDFMEQARREGLEFVLATREGTAAFMADAYGQLSGLPGVCMSTMGPGSTNLVNGVAAAFLDRTPMLAISGQINTARQQVFTHQNVDHVRLFSSITKWTATLVPEAAGSIMRKAFRVATAERPGPVHLTAAANIVSAEATDSEVRLPPLGMVAQSTQMFTTGGEKENPLQQFARARRPVILAGIAAMRCEAGPSLIALAEHAGCPVVVSPKSKGILPEDHPYFAGTIDMACNQLVWSFLGSADLILAVGFDAVELIKDWKLSVPVLHLDTTPNTDQVYPADVEWVGYIPAMLDELRESYTGESKWEEREVKRHREKLSESYYAGRVEGKLNPSDVIDAVRAASPRDTIITTDVGSHKLLVGQGWPAYEPRSVLMTNGLSAMGFALPGAMVAKLVRRQRPVVCFTGDGGLAMVQGELRLAASLELPLVVVVFCDDTLHRIEIKQIAKKYPSWGTRFEPTDMVKLAESMSCYGERVETPKGLQEVMERAFGLDRPLVIEARIDTAQYSAQF
jgi:acetolactate synthase-1/2/3 large subunit